MWCLLYDIAKEHNSRFLFFLVKAVFIMDDLLFQGKYEKRKEFIELINIFILTELKRNGGSL